MEKAQVTAAQLLKAGEDPTVTLQLPNQAFHQMPFPVQMRVVHHYHLAVGTAWYHRRHALGQNVVAQSLGVISFVPNDVFSGIASQQRFGLGNVVLLSSRQDEPSAWGGPRPSTVTCTLALNPPRLRPKAWADCPPSFGKRPRRRGGPAPRCCR